MRVTQISILYNYFAYTALLVLSLTSCSEFVEYPLEGKEVELLAPLNKSELNDTLVHFWWEEHEDAKFYRLQVVSPNFEQVTSSILDTLVTGDKASIKVPEEGSYTWRLRPENHGSVGSYTYGKFDRIP